MGRSKNTFWKPPVMLEPPTIALFFTVILLAVTTYFLLGSIPLLTLRHDHPMDARFVRSFYVTYFKMAFVAALAATASYAFAGRPLLALGAVTIAGMTVYVRSQLVSQMAAWGSQIGLEGAAAIRSFRKTHRRAIAINTGQLAIILSSLGSI
jgi:hypothetical protein